MDTHAHIFNPDFPLSASRSYTPGRAMLSDYAVAAARWGTGRVVLVQPSPYGSDNAALVAALKELGSEKARGIAVISQDSTTMQLDDLAEAGVVGVRLNRQANPNGGYEPLEKTLEQLIGKVADRGWVVQVYSDPASLAGCSAMIANSPVPVLMDHYAGLKVSADGFADGTDLVLDLVKNPNAWVKLSGPYRAVLDGVQHAALEDLSKKLVAAIPDRLVWGSDWPYTGGGKDRANRSVTDIEPFRAFDATSYLQQISEWVGSQEQLEKLLVRNPAALFGF